MLRVDFYVLQSQSHHERLQFAARLAEKAWAQQCDVAFLVADEATAQTLDSLLWEFKPESFLPHGRGSSGDPLVIGTDAEALPARQLLINLGHTMPETQAQRLAEIVIQTPDVLDQTRRRYSRYKEIGHNINTHKLP